MNVLPEIPSRGHYIAIGTGKFCAVAWRHGVSERVILHFLGPNAARYIAEQLNFVHEDIKTGETLRNWELLKIAWGVKEKSRIILPAGFVGR